MNDGGPAFPGQMATGYDARSGNYNEGMTLRDYFAAKALQGFLSNHEAMEQLDDAISKFTTDHEVRRAVAINDVLSKRAYMLADAMLARRTEDK